MADLAAAAGGSPRDIVAAIGPSIGPCCYEVGPEVRETFHVAGFAERDLDRWFLPAESPRATHVLDMWRSNRDQLIAAGLDPANVHVAGLCTATHNDWFWSYRREGARGPAGCSPVIRAGDDAGGAQARLSGTARRSRSRAWRTRLTSVSDVNGFSSRSTLRPSWSPRLPG